MNISRWIWLAPVVFLLHDAEEVATVLPWLRANAARLPAIARPYVAQITTPAFAVAVGVLLAGVVLASWHGAQRVRRGMPPWPFLIVAGALAGNAVTHVGQAVYFGGYTPGIVTAVVLVVPYAVGLARALRDAGMVTRRQLAVLLTFGVVIQTPIAIAGLAAGQFLAAGAP